MPYTKMIAAGVAAIGLSAGMLGLARSHESASPPQPVVQSATTAASQQFAVDPVHSSVMFKIKHADAAYFYGRFNEVAGSFVLGDSGGNLNVTVQTASIDTNSAGRDNHLKGPDFFNAREHPEISFNSTNVKKTAENKYKATGTISLHGVSKEITVDIEHTGYGEFRGQRAGFEAQFTIDRTEFGMTKYVEEGVLGANVTLIVAIEGVAG